MDSLDLKLWSFFGRSSKGINTSATRISFIVISNQIIYFSKLNLSLEKIQLSLILAIVIWLKQGTSPRCSIMLALLNTWHPKHMRRTFIPKKVISGPQESFCINFFQDVPVMKVYQCNHTQICSKVEELFCLRAYILIFGIYYKTCYVYINISALTSPK